MNTIGQPAIETGASVATNYTWYRGETTEFLPNMDALRSANGIIDFVLKGWVPESPYVTPAMNITAFGSCFAEHIGKWLASRNYNVLTDKSNEGQAYVIRCGEGMVNSFTIRGQFEWALEGHTPNGEFWHGYEAQAFGYDETVREETGAIFRKTDLFILTFGLSEVWYDKPTGEVFWRAVPADKFNGARHGFRIATVEENEANIARICELIRKHVPGAKVILTLSPIPLIATFRPMSCLTANAVSKASLRLAIDRVLEANQGDAALHYWPSYEIVTEAFVDKWGADRRHVKKPILNYIMTLFEYCWCTKKPSEAELYRSLYEARVADGSISRQVRQLLEKRDHAGLDKLLANWRSAGLPKFADFVERSALALGAEAE